MNMFAWLRTSIAESIYDGWKDGIARIERELGDATRAATSPTAQDNSPPLTEVPPPPLAQLVQQLRLNSPTSEPKASGPAASDKTPGPRRHVR